MRLNLRSKTIIVILVTSLVALLTAGIFINWQVQRDFNRFLDRQAVFLDENIGAPPPRGMRMLMQEQPHRQLQDEFIDHVWRGIALAGVLAVVVAVGVGWFFAQRITSPLERLQRNISKLKEHLYTEPVAVIGQDEIGELSLAFEDLRLELQRVEELRKDVVSDMAHELTTPLQALLGIVEGVEEGIYEPKEKAPQMKQAISDMRALVDDMRLFSHARAKAREIAREKIRLKDFVEHETGSLLHEAGSKGLEVKIEIEDAFTAEADRSMLAHIFNNVIRNAIQFTDTGHIRIATATEADGKKHILIEDSGIGIAEKDLPYIFERFYRADRSRSKETGGTGLGLAIVKEYVEQLGWEIAVQAEVGKGTTFTITCT
jgi:signal transduction histidine kinase